MKLHILFYTFLFSSLSLNAQCWNLVWEDEFNGTTLDLNKWEYQIGGSGWGNAELQYYTNGDNVEVSAGSLKITAEEDVNNNYPSNAYTSSRIRTINKGDWKYGKFEARIKLPEGQGIWPAFWMMPSESVYGGWPSSGEIDIMEYLGHDTDRTYGTCHFGNSPGDKGSLGTSWDLSTGNFNDGFHTFTVEWSPGEIRWFVDGNVFLIINDSHPFFDNYLYPFDQKFHFILNVAVGGNWPGYPDATTSFPQTMEVDWVRVYQQLPDVEIDGALTATPYAQNISYELPDLAGASYTWTVPSTATIVSGQNTNEIIVDWEGSGGTISGTINTSCGSYDYDTQVNISPNLWENYGFESAFNFWNTNTFGGAASFNLDTSSPQEASTNLCVNSTALGGNPWDIQLSRSLSLTAGEEYTISFWAKSNTNGSDVDINFINATTYANYAFTSFTLSNDWNYYEFTFTAPVSANCLFTIDLGDEIAETCFDNFSFTNYQGSELSFRVFLEGFVQAGGTMGTGLNSSALIPQQQAFNTSPWNYSGGEQITNLSAQAVDWVLINLYDASENIIESQPGLLYDNGMVFTLNGTTNFRFNAQSADVAYASIHHKSHLAVVAEVNGNGFIDFSQAGTALGVQQTKTVNGVEAAYSGDFDGNGVINNMDFNIWSSNSAVVNQYVNQDTDGNAVVNNNDFNFWTINRSKVGNTIVYY